MRNPEPTDELLEVKHGFAARRSVEHAVAGVEKAADVMSSTATMPAALRMITRFRRTELKKALPPKKGTMNGKVYSLLLVLMILACGNAWAQPNANAAPTQYVRVGTDRIAYRSFGTGQPLLLLNRLRGTLDTWDPLFLDHLALANRVIILDYPGIGYSTGKLPPDIGLAADFIAAFADSLHLAHFVLAGWSWGGTVVQTFILEHPGRATSAVLIATAPPGHNVKGIEQAFLDRAFKPVNDLDDEVVLFFEPESERSRAAAKASHERIYSRPGVAQRIPSEPDVIKSFLTAAATYHDDKPGRLGKLMTTRLPILILSGTHDISTPVENWFALNGKLRGAHLIVYPDSGHAPQHEYPALAAEHIALFEKTLTSEGTK